MELKINGQTKDIPDVQSIADIIGYYELNERIIVVEHNLTIIPREHYEDTLVAPGDKIEIVHFVGGG